MYLFLVCIHFLKVTPLDLIKMFVHNMFFFYLLLFLKGSTVFKSCLFTWCIWICHTDFEWVGKM